MPHLRKKSLLPTIPSTLLRELRESVPVGDGYADTLRFLLKRTPLFPSDLLASNGERNTRDFSNA